MGQRETEQGAFRIDPATRIGWLALAVADLERSLRFYTDTIGFTVLDRQSHNAILGIDESPQLILLEQPGAQPRPPGTTGLYHFAILVPGRQELARSLQRLVTQSYPLGGAADHLVSEALYLSDPDGNGIEIYRDRPRESWRWDEGHVQMATEPLDLRGLLAEAEANHEPWRGLPQETVIGHIHLQVSDIKAAGTFYHGVLGFDVVAHLPSALFVSAGDYHHHVGLNTWQSRHGPPPPTRAVGLRQFTIVVPGVEASQQVASQLRSAGVPYSEVAGGLAFQDPWVNSIIVIPESKLSTAATTITGG